MQRELTAAIVQDARDGRVLMLAWMDDEALRLTRETGEAWFWSRSRSRLWKKGETSGNILAVEEGRGDWSGGCATTATATRSCCACDLRGRRVTPAPRRALRLPCGGQSSSGFGTGQR